MDFGQLGLSIEIVFSFIDFEKYQLHVILIGLQIQASMNYSIYLSLHLENELVHKTKM